jgi:serine/threonine protein kinase
MESKKSDWERVTPKPLGGGGQSDVYLVRTPERTKQRASGLQAITNTNQSPQTLRFAEAIRDYTREDLPAELGAMKEFKLRNDEQQSLRRLQQEVNVLQENRPGLPMLLGSNVNERWMVTEYFSNGTLEDHLSEYKGKPALALKAFRSLVRTVSLLHKEGIVHRDIKPANIFVTKDHQLILGDFGLVFVPDQPPRLTASGESVGAGDFIPPWGDMGRRLENVKPNFDVYMLGKVLWCMVAGNPVLKREYFKEPDNDVTKLFPSDPHAHMINVILEHSVVERQEKCFSSADNLLLVVRTNLESIEQGGQLLQDGIPRICRVCGVGRYARLNLYQGNTSYNLRLWNSGGMTDISLIGVEVWECDTCHHLEFFRTNPRR